MRRIAVLLPPVAALILWAPPRTAEACSCAMPPAPKAALKQASAVFEGKVVKVDQVAEKHRLTARIEVSRWWKGGGSAHTNVATIDIGSMCGLGFVVGDVWLIYADGADDALSASMCSRSRKKADVMGDYKDLGAGKPADPNKPSPAEAAAEPAPPAEPAPAAEPAAAEPAPPAKVESPPTPAPAPAASAAPAAPQPAATQGCTLAGSTGGGLAGVLLVASWVRRRARRRSA